MIYVRANPQFRLPSDQSREEPLSFGLNPRFNCFTPANPDIPAEP